MSETEHKTGYLVDTGKFFMDYLITHDIPEYYDNEEEYFADLENVILFEGTVWEVQDENNVSQDGDIFSSTRESNCLISYEVKYHNGGCGNKEAIVTALDNIQE